MNLSLLICKVGVVMPNAHTVTKMEQISVCRVPAPREALSKQGLLLCLRFQFSAVYGNTGVLSLAAGPFSPGPSHLCPFTTSPSPPSPCPCPLTQHPCPCKNAAVPAQRRKLGTLWVSWDPDRALGQHPGKVGSIWGSCSLGPVSWWKARRPAQSPFSRPGPLACSIGSPGWQDCRDC